MDSEVPAAQTHVSVTPCVRMECRAGPSMEQKRKWRASHPGLGFCQETVKTDGQMKECRTSVWVSAFKSRV